MVLTPVPVHFTDKSHMEWPGIKPETPPWDFVNYFPSVLSGDFFFPIKADLYLVQFPVRQVSLYKKVFCSFDARIMIGTIAILREEFGSFGAAVVTCTVSRLMRGFFDKFLFTVALCSLMASQVAQHSLHLPSDKLVTLPHPHSLSRRSVWRRPGLNRTVIPSRTGFSPL